MAPTPGGRLTLAAVVAVAVVVIVLGAVARSYLLRDPQDRAADSGTDAPGGPPSPAPASGAATAAVDLDAATRRFARARSAAAPGTWVYLTEGPVITPGAIDEWDDYSIGSPWVLGDSESGGGYRLWYRGCSLGVRGRRCSIGHARSPDGIRWRKTEGPAFDPPEPVAAANLAGVTVVRANDRYHLWYSIAPAWFQGQKTSTVHLATSADGARWEPAGQVFAGTEQNERHLEPSALWDGKGFHLWVVDSMHVLDSPAAVPDNPPFLRHLVSHDGRAWKETATFPLGTLQIPRVRARVAPRRGGGYRAALWDFETASLSWIESPDGDTWELASSPKTTLEVGPADQVDTFDDVTTVDTPDGTLAWMVGGKKGMDALRIAFLRR